MGLWPPCREIRSLDKIGGIAISQKYVFSKSPFYLWVQFAYVICNRKSSISSCVELTPFSRLRVQFCCQDGSTRLQIAVRLTQQKLDLYK